MSVADEVFAIFAQGGSDAYFGECISVTAHGLQAAWFAQQEGAASTLVIAALLHDIGHLIGNAPEDLEQWTRDARHERVGGTWLSRRFGPEVSDPVRLHVAAKRYLCAAEPGYFGTLSPASVHTLRLQGGPMSPEQQSAFELEPYFRDALRVRRWDERAKVADLEVPQLHEYRQLIEAHARHT